MSNILTTSFSYSVNGYRQVGFAVSPSTPPTVPSFTGTPIAYYTTANTTTFGGSYTVPSASNQVLFAVAVYYYGTPSSATFGATSMTQYYENYGSIGIVHAIYYLINPTVTTDTVTVTLDASGGTAVKSVGIFTLQGVNQTTPINHLETVEGDSVTSTNLTCDPIVNYSLLLGSVSDFGFSGEVINTTDGGQSEKWNFHPAATNVTNSFSSKTADIALEVNVNDQITLTESISLGVLLIDISVTESLTTSEFTNYVTTIPGVSLVENLVVTDSAEIDPPALSFSPNVKTNITLTELVTPNLLISLSVSDTLLITDNYSVSDPAIAALINVFSDLSISESTSFETFKNAPATRSRPVGRVTWDS